MNRTKLLVIFSLTTLFITACDSARSIGKTNLYSTETPSVTITLLVETAYHQTNLNDVIDACSHVKSFKTYSVNFITQDKMEVQLIYRDLTPSQKSEIYNHLNCLGGVKVMNVPGN